MFGHKGRPAKQATLEEKNLDLSVSQVRIRLGTCITIL